MFVIEIIINNILLTGCTLNNMRVSFLFLKILEQISLIIVSLDDFT